MEKKFTVKFLSILLIFILSITFSFNIKAQKVEKLVIYENFGGPDAGSSVPGIQPEKWPAVLSDSGKHSGWDSKSQFLDKINACMVPEFYNNDFFHIDSVKKYRTGGLDGLNITVNDLIKTWSKNINLLNGYQIYDTYEEKNKSTTGIKFFGATVLPDFYSWISYAPYTPSFLKYQVDEKGYIYAGKNITKMNNQRPIITIPEGDYDVLKDISKIEMLISGSRVSHNNTISIVIEQLDKVLKSLGADTFTFSVALEPRLISIPVNKQYCRIYIQTWGSNSNNSVTDYYLLNSNTEIDTKKPFNYYAIACIKPDGQASSGQISNPGIQIHMIKVYAFMTGTGYTITTDPSLVTGKTSGIEYNESVQLTANVTNASGKKFMGWRISGKPDLSEVVNPLSINVTSDMTIMPLYAGDEAELPVVNENFTNWQQKGDVSTDPLKHNMLDYTTNPPKNTVWTGTVKVPLRYGFTSDGKDSVDINLVKCNVIPYYGPRVYNIPDADKYTGYVAFMGPNDAKGYVSVGSITGITNVEIDVSSYDLPAPERACAVLVNGSIVRNKMLQKLYPEKITITNDPANPITLQIGPGNQARIEYLTPASPTADILSSNIAAAAVALHNLKMYAKITLPEANYYKLTIIETSEGKVCGINPAAGNSTNHYMAGTKVSLTALANGNYGFEGWYDDKDNFLGSQNPITITMDADKSVKPKFTQYPSYIKLIANNKGSVTSVPSPQKTYGDTLQFLAGINVKLTATPVYGFKFNKWVKNGVDFNINPLEINGTEMLKNTTMTISVVYDSITTRQMLTINNDTTQGKIEFNHQPEEYIAGAMIQTGKFPTGESIEITAKPNYSYGFNGWKGGEAIAAKDTGANPVSVLMNTDKVVTTKWKVLSRRLLIIENAPHGSVRITDAHKDGVQELNGFWPADYDVQLTASPDKGYVLASLGPNVSAIFINDSVVTVRMDKDTVTVVPEFVVRQEGVILAVKENFQNPILWPENEGTISNVPGVIDFLGLSPDWDPRTYNNNLNGLLKILAPYRTWGSQNNENSDGPNGTKNPKTTLFLVYKNQPLTNKIKIGTSKDSVKITVANFAPCNNCVIGKAVKEANIGNHYLGQVTPGMVALKKLNVTDRLNADNPAFIENDTVGMMLVEGLAYVEKVEVGYVSNGSQFAPGVFYTTDETINPISETGVFAASYSDLWPIGQISRPDYSPYQNLYGWGSCQEGMIMDQNMYIAEEGVKETKVLITSGYKKSGNTYAYTDIYIHDLKIWGSPKNSNSIGDMVVNSNDKCKFYLLGNTGMLKVETNERIKALVIYNVKGSAVKVITSLNDNLANVQYLPSGFYAVQAYTENGIIYTGRFIKIK
jgi:hypothetical protein